MSTFPKRKLGKNGPEVSVMGFGNYVYGKPDSDEVRFKLLDHIHQSGVTFWDTADVYHDSEDFLGKWFARTGKRDEIFLATKFGGEGSGNKNDPAYIKEACSKSLKRMGIDKIDLYFCHRLTRKVPVEIVVKTMVELKEEGKIKYLGLSECSSESLRRACKVHHIDAVQIEYSPFTTDIEDPQINLLKTAQELGVAVVAYSPLGRGMLTGKLKSIDDFEEGDLRLVYSPRLMKENFHKNLELVERIEAIAKRKKCMPGQLVLAWIMAQGDGIFPIPGTRRIKYFDENIEAINVQISDSDDAEMRKAIEACEIHGERYPAEFLSNLFADTPPLE